MRKYPINSAMVIFGSIAVCIGCSNTPLQEDPLQPLDSDLRCAHHRCGACGDGICSARETCSSCPQDCGQCPPPSICGDGICNGAENCSSCESDCACEAPAIWGGGGTPGACGISSGTGGSGGASGIAQKYPGDQGIGDDPDVIFADDFESYANASDLWN